MSLSATVKHLAEHTPTDRNRVVDLLRAAAIAVVVVGHWLMAAVHVDASGDLRRGDLLSLADWTHPLTWVLQVMPVFFLVGGYANALSWRGAQLRGASYGAWLRARLRRLIIPVLPLMVFWAVVAPAAHGLGVSPAALRIASMASLVPTWFLAAYVVVVALTPVTLALWDRLGWGSVVAGVLAGGLIDAVSITTDQLLVGFLNYVVVWGTVHQLGYAWLDGALSGTRRRLVLAAVGLAGLLVLVVAGPYAVSMVGLDGTGINNAYPTRVTLAFLGLMQAGVVMALEPLLRILAERPRVWRAVIVVNARIMTVYLWHLTALGVVVALSLTLDGAGLRLTPNTASWWVTRPLWILVLGLATAGLVALLGRFEQPAADHRPAPHPARPLLAMVGVCAGLGLMADIGVVTADGTLRWYLPLLPVVVCLVFGVTALNGRHLTARP
ncbi:acyltransferase [Nocardioides sp.]|uniref:acyltransferase family protein n=1 Tax=Nocardioides sp. TaxID=35761 RepID=UPI002732C795|nr:acyltransferase [Nocardioides sp.]MDP3890964.1 acyltransferase [Nocardioides sp.]